MTHSAGTKSEALLRHRRSCESCPSQFSGFAKRQNDIPLLTLARAEFFSSDSHSRFTIV
jgi:transcriptional regulator NrdR family protein